MKVRLAEPARDDLQRLIRTTAMGDPVRATRLNRTLRLAFRAIAAAPLRCQIVRSSRHVEVRKKAWRPQLVLFRIDADGVLILRIAHERSDWTSLV